ncbi:XRE family transcriptional regulator [Xenorhabdus sp. XENO-7]|uniref:XRE family transcriptional regulator n=1 Tax=Xenorhabdus aichiensis TaxID=3025874 RepID=A0ABT5MBE0_9GAMM|nr:XRE family transcriptional regulator [Xenorhabdus aichiensis]MDC9623576.1 XRE family transcriptional regulator [Xenorhabdus aichiensis]
MKIDDNFKTRISLARKAIDITQGELADKVGVVRRQIAAYEAGDSKPREKVLINLAAVLGTTVEWLSQGVGDGPELNNVTQTVTVLRVPVYSYEQAFEQGLLLLTKKDNEFYISSGKYVEVPSGFSNRAFGVEVQGDSMESTSGVSFYHGMIVIFDPAYPAKNGELVLIADLANKTSIFRQLIKDQGYWYLRPLNDNYPIIDITHELELIAVGIHAMYTIPNPSVLRKANYSPSSHGNLSSIEKRMERIESMLEQLLDKKAP